MKPQYALMFFCSVSCVQAFFPLSPLRKKLKPCSMLIQLLMLYRRLDRVRVVGIYEPVRLSELLDTAENADDWDGVYNLSSK
jgi:hypothetical protein